MRILDTQTVSIDRAGKSNRKYFYCSVHLVIIWKWYFARTKVFWTKSTI